MQTQASPAAPPRPTRATLALFVALSCIYLLLARGRITSIDEWHVYGTTESLAERGSWQLQVEGIRRKYSRYSFVPSLLGVPFYKAAAALAAPPAGMSWRDVFQAAATLQTPLVTAATAAILFFGLCRLHVEQGCALAAALVYAFGTMALPYSASLYVQPMAALGMAWVVTSAALGAGGWLAVGLAVLLLVRLESLLLLPVLALHVWRFHRPALKGLSWLLGGAVVGTAGQVVVNLCRDDPALAGDYGAEGFTTPLWIGLHGLLVSPGKGLLWFTPAAALGLLLMPWFVRAVPRVGLLACGVTVTVMLMVACWWTWHGARSWGPRLLVPLMPVLVLPLAWLFHEWRQRRAEQRVATVLVIAASVAVQFWGALRDPVSESVVIWPPLEANENESIYIPQTGPWGVAGQEFPDLLLVRVWQRDPAWRLTTTLVASALAAIAAIAFWSVVRWSKLPGSLSRELVAVNTPRGWAMLAASVALVLAPSIGVKLLMAGSGSRGPGVGLDTPTQFSRLARPAANRLTGHLYVPLRGDYVFFSHGPSETRFALDGVPLLETDPRARMAARTLEVGFHRLDVEGKTPGEFNSLYWTTPGNAHYKEPVAQLYLVGPQTSWRDRAAIILVHGRWCVWVLVAVGLLYGSRAKDR